MTDESFVVEFRPKSEGCKEVKKVHAQIVHVPQNKNLVYSDDNPSLKEHLHSIGIQNDTQLQKQLLSGYFDYQNSRLNEQPRPLHVFAFRPTQHKKVAVAASCIWYKDKIKVYNLSDLPLDF
ncbi:MAG: hypothetical protein RLZZ301_322 [Bacteroidota bacterium]|jgi:hypothetical protein